MGGRTRSPSPTSSSLAEFSSSSCSSVSSGSKHASQMIYTLVTSALMGLISIGYKTKLSALALVSLLCVHNITHNCFWTINARKPLRDFLRYDFFQTLSFMGGLLMVVVIGPGEVSFDEKKKW